MLSILDIEKKFFLQLVFILCLCLICVILFSVVGLVLSVGLYDFNPNNAHNIANLMENEVDGYKIIQLSGSIGLFLIPPVLYGVFTSKNSLDKLGFKIPNKSINYLLVFILMIVSAPFISWVIEMNANMALPDFLDGVQQWMKKSESEAEHITRSFLTFDGLGSLFYVMVIVAIVPAVGEELLFRGVLQNIFIGWCKNAHLGIWITAILFSALHMQFFGFFPRVLLGVLFGYIFWWSKSLWLPILGHFINNGSIVIASYLYPESVEQAEISILEGSENPWIYYAGSFILAVIIFYFIRKVNNKDVTNNQTITP